MSTCAANQADKCCQLKPVLCSSAFRKRSVFVSPRGEKSGWVGSAPAASEWALVQLSDTYFASANPSGSLARDVTQLLRLVPTISDQIILGILDVYKSASSN